MCCHVWIYLAYMTFSLAIYGAISYMWKSIYDLLRVIYEERLQTHMRCACIYDVPFIIYYEAIFIYGLAGSHIWTTSIHIYEIVVHICAFYHHIWEKLASYVIRVPHMTWCGVPYFKDTLLRMEVQIIAKDKPSAQVMEIFVNVLRNFWSLPPNNRACAARQSWSDRVMPLNSAAKWGGYSGNHFALLSSNVKLSRNDPKAPTNTFGYGASATRIFPPHPSLKI